MTPTDDNEARKAADIVARLLADLALEAADALRAQAAEIARLTEQMDPTSNHYERWWDTHVLDLTETVSASRILAREEASRSQNKHPGPIAWNHALCARMCGTGSLPIRFHLFTYKGREVQILTCDECAVCDECQPPATTKEGP